MPIRYNVQFCEAENMATEPEQFEPAETVSQQVERILPTEEIPETISKNPVEQTEEEPKCVPKKPQWLQTTGRSVSDILQNEFGEKLPDPQKKKRQRRRKKFIPVLTDLLWVTQKVNVYSIILLTMQVTDN